MKNDNKASFDEARMKQYLNLNRINNIFNSLDIGIHIVDSNGITILYNQACEEIEGISNKWILGKDMKILVNEGIYSESIALEVIESGKKVSKSQRVNDKYIFSTGVPIYSNEKLVAVVASIMDMTKIEELKFKYNELKSINKRIQDELDMLSALETQKNVVIAKSKSMKSLIQLALRVAKVDSNILIEGESGVGKGILSKYIHDNSNRKSGPFVKVDCSSLPESLIESEIFGYERGAFTGARKEGKMGLIQLANGGTLFLDEIGELSLRFQVKLLSVLQDKVFQKVGGVENIQLDIRIIAATNRNLYNMVEEGKFRKDLYYRLKVVPINIPPLRERKDDIVPLINSFLRKHNEHYNYDKVISSKAMKLLINYDWPGNVRELDNEVERLVVTSETNTICEEDILNGDICKGRTIQTDENKTFKENVHYYESILLNEYINNASNIHELSSKTGLESSTLRKKAKKLGINLEFQKRKNS